MNEYIIKYRIGTYWTALQETAWNTYQEFVTAESAKEAWRQKLGHYKNLFSNPNKSIELISAQKI